MILSRRALMTLITGIGMGGVATALRAAPLPEGDMVPVELFQDAQELESAVRLGHPHGDVIMIEFFDYNCPWCKRSATDLTALLKAEPDLSYVLVNFAVLGEASVQATKVALGFRKLMGPEKYLALHLALFSLKGAVNGERAIAEAVRLGANEKDLIAAANAPTTIAEMKAALGVGNALGFTVTPSFTLGNIAYSGGLALPQKRAIIAHARLG